MSASTGSGRHRGGLLARLFKRNHMASFEFFAGIDWGSETHHVFVVDGETLGEGAFRHSGAGLAEVTDWLLDTTDAQPHGIEVPHGPVVETLMERGFTVHAVNPKQFDRFRDRWSPAGAKDDRRDAWTLSRCLANRRPGLSAPGSGSTGSRRTPRGGRAWPAISPATRHASSTVPASSSGATTRSSSGSKAISPGPGSANSGAWRRPPKRRAPRPHQDRRQPPEAPSGLQD